MRVFREIYNNYISGWLSVKSQSPVGRDVNYCQTIYGLWTCECWTKDLQIILSFWIASEIILFPWAKQKKLDKRTIHLYVYWEKIASYTFILFKVLPCYRIALNVTIKKILSTHLRILKHPLHCFPYNAHNKMQAINGSVSKLCFNFAHLPYLRYRSYKPQRTRCQKNTQHKPSTDKTTDFKDEIRLLMFIYGVFQFKTWLWETTHLDKMPFDVKPMMSQSSMENISGPQRKHIWLNLSLHSADELRRACKKHKRRIISWEFYDEVWCVTTTNSSAYLHFNTRFVYPGISAVNWIN